MIPCYVIHSIIRWRMADHIWSCCELSVGGQSSLSVGDVLSNLIHSLCEGIHTVGSIVRYNSCSHMTWHNCWLDMYDVHNSSSEECVWLLLLLNVACTCAQYMYADLVTPHTGGAQVVDGDACVWGHGTVYGELVGFWRDQLMLVFEHY